ncbi:RING-box protein 2 isoform X1 [Crotalus tigris]|uniref:RING-box protein 2 isoform X1 n=1 Tax=Crotalus tigris TaxID=88082 RepID=UPI00192F9710|nr:RING-box protein 2 isoform X1 [Crotalus tigris]
MADVEDGDEPGISTTHSGSSGAKAGGADKMFSLKKWNAVAMWSWDVECDTCAICRVQVMGKRSGGRQARSERKAASPLCSPGTGMGRAGAKTASPHSPPPSPMPVLDVKLKTNKKIALWSGESVIIPSTIAACRYG